MEKEVIINSFRGKRLYRKFLSKSIKEHKELVERLDDEQRNRMRFISALKEVRSFPNKSIDEIYDRFEKKFETYPSCSRTDGLIEEYKALANQKLDICKENISNIKEQKSAIEKHIYNRRNKEKSKWIEKTLNDLISFNSKLNLIPVLGAAFTIIAGVAGLVSVEVASFILPGCASIYTYLEVQNEKTKVLKSKVT